MNPSADFLKNFLDFPIKNSESSLTHCQETGNKEKPMQTFKIKKKIDSEILYLPEFKNMIGRNVEIIIAVEPDAQSLPARDISELEGFLKPPSVPVTVEEMNAVIRSRGSGLC
jgi:hypothetical protein